VGKKTTTGKMSGDERNTTRRSGKGDCNGEDEWEEGRQRTLSRVRSILQAVARLHDVARYRVPGSRVCVRPVK
jgi:hypothetical protein